MLASCEKVTEQPQDLDPMFVENSEEWINGILYVDGTTQIDRIEDVSIEGVSVIDGRFKFDKSEHLFDAVKSLSSTNDESRVNYYDE